MTPAASSPAAADMRPQRQYPGSDRRTMLVIGGRDMDAGAVSVRLHGKGNVGAKPKGEVVADILTSIKERRA